MKSSNTLTAIALLASTSAWANPLANSGLVSVFATQTAQLNVVSVGDPAKTCRFRLSFIDFDNQTVPGGTITPAGVPTELAGGESAFLTVGPLQSTILMRAHIDFTDQLVANAGQADPLDGCYRLIPTFEVKDATSTRVLDTQFYGLPHPLKEVNHGKITICHKPGTPAQKTLSIPPAALQGHIGHGDDIGACP